LRKAVEEKIVKYWSPELVAGRIAKEYPQLPSISHESIYKWIYASMPYLINYLARSPKEGKHYKRGHNRKQSKMKILR
jgi:IS30 family transposase